jgi:hypothetical protein
MRTRAIFISYRCVLPFCLLIELSNMGKKIFLLRNFDPRDDKERPYL